jgi:HEAT repeat protein
VVEALGRIGKPGVAELIEALGSKNEFLLEQAAALGKMGAAAREAVPVLVGMLKKKDDNDRTRAARTLASSLCPSPAVAFWCSTPCGITEFGTLHPTSRLRQ